MYKDYVVLYARRDGWTLCVCVCFVLALNGYDLRGGGECEGEEDDSKLHYLDLYKALLKYVQLTLANERWPGRQRLVSSN